MRKNINTQENQKPTGRTHFQKLILCLFVSCLLVLNLLPSAAFASSGNSVTASPTTQASSSATAAQASSSATAALSTEEEDPAEATIEKVTIYYRYIDTGDTTVQEKHTYDPDDKSTYPTIYEGRNIVPSAKIEMSDGTTIEIAEKSKTWKWKIHGNLDENGNITSTDLVSIASDGTIESRDSNGGTCYLTYTLYQFKDYTPEDIMVNVVAPPVKKVKSIDIQYIDADHEDLTNFKTSDMPSIKVSGNTVLLYATINYTDGTSVSTANAKQKSDPSFPKYKWTLTSCVDFEGKNLSRVVASVTETGTATARGQGNGFMNIRFTLTGYKDVYQDTQVQLMLDDSSPYPKSIALYLDEACATPYTSSSNITLSSTSETAHFYTQVTWSDGSKTLAEYGQVKYSVAKTVSLEGEEQESTIVRVSQTGVIRPIGRGNGTVTIKACYLSNESMTATATLTVTGSEAKIVGMDMDFYDDLNPSGVAYDESTDTIPQIRSKMGQMHFIPTVMYSTGSVKKASATDFEWSIAETVDFNGNLLSKDIATVSENGYVFAKGVGNGIVKVRCVSKTDLSLTGIYQVEIRGNSTIPWVTKVEILDENGKAYGDNSVNLSEAKIVQLYARVTYSNGTVKSTYDGDVIENLVWGPSIIEGASIDQVTGQFIPTKTFTSARVTASVVGGGFYGQDIKGRVWVQIMQSAQETGTPAESLTLKVVYAADYKADGINAKACFEKTFTAAQVTSLFSPTYRTYTFSKGPSDVDGSYTKWGVLTAFGVSLKDLVLSTGVSMDDLIALRFYTPDNYNPAAYSSNDIFGTRYYYPNFSIGIEKNSPSASGACTVEASLALSSYIEYETDNTLRARDYGQLSSSTRFRLCIGLDSLTGSNTFESAKNVNEIAIIIKDGSYQYGEGTGDGDGGGDGDGSGEGTGDGDGKGDGDGTGEGTGDGDGDGKQQGDENGTGESNSEGGVGNDSSKDASTSDSKKGAVTINPSNDAGGKKGGNGTGDGTGESHMYLRKIVSSDTGTYYVDDNSATTVMSLVIAGIVAALALGLAKTGASYRRRLRRANFSFFLDNDDSAEANGGAK